MTRSGKALLNATRPYIEQSQIESWWHVCSTLALLMASLAIAGLSPWWPARLAGAILSGLMMNRVFILYHDYMHGSILKGSWLAKPVLYVIGLLFLAPPNSWRASHNHHHANVAKLHETAIGSYKILTTAEWRRATRWQRFCYRLSRHPLTILDAYLTIFTLIITINSLVKHPRKNWDSALALVTHGAVCAGLWVLGGPGVAFFVILLPFSIAAMMGAYLFYAQHSFPGVKMLSPHEWTYYHAAVQSSSYMKVGRVMSWFLGNIGYHHVHHLNPSIPFYRLPEAMANIPELQHPTITSLSPRDILACLRANLWDEDSSRMVSYREAANCTPMPPRHPDNGSSSIKASALNAP